MKKTISIRGALMKTVIAIAVCLGLVAGGLSTPVQAATPTLEKIKYEGKGLVEVEFNQDVKYKNLKIKVKDEKGKKYKTTVIKKDDDEILFKVKKIKKGHTYTVKIKGVKKEYTKKYGTVKGKFTVKKASKAAITAADAKAIALKHAGFKASQVRGLEVEKDYEYGQKIYEVSFERGHYDYDYDISASTGKILHHDKEYDD